MELSEQERQARGRHSHIQPKSCHLVPDQGNLKNVKVESTKVQVTGERPVPDPTSLEFEIATLAADGSGFTGDETHLLHSQVVSLRRM